MNAPQVQGAYPPGVESGQPGAWGQPQMQGAYAQGEESGLPSEWDNFGGHGFATKPGHVPNAPAVLRLIAAEDIVSIAKMNRRAKW